MTASPSEQGVSFERDGGVLRVVLDRPSRKNSLDPESVVQIVRALEAAATDDDLRVVLLSASGDDFCAGADWVGSNRQDAARPRTGSIQRRTPLQAHRLIELLLQIQLPVVSEVRGWAAGLGCQLALASDFVVAADTSRFWLPFTRRGFSPDSGTSWLLPRLIGVARAKELLLLGRVVTGAEAAEWGMIHRAVSEGDVATEVAALVDELANSATVAVGLAKQCVNRGLELGLSEAMTNESFALELASRTADFKEGLLAFTERRDANFVGR
jgi:2-(1,2-epoxy-1,2-dihydrophenyl)acetyl-CoA isomerase